MRAGFRFRMDDDRAGPEFLRAGARVGDGRGAVHAGCLRRVDVELARPYDAHAVELPLAVRCAHGGIMQPARWTKKREFESEGTAEPGPAGVLRAPAGPCRAGISRGEGPRDRRPASAPLCALAPA